MNFQSLLNRIKALLIKPKETWPEIAAEPATPQSLLTSVILPLAAIPAICLFIGLVVVGISVGPFGTVRLTAGSGISQAILSYGFAVGGVFLLALVIDALAPNFGGEKNFVQSLKLAAFSSIPGWLGGVFCIIPSIVILALLAGIYGLCLLYMGLPVLKKCPQEKHAGYFVVTLLTMFVSSIIVTYLPGRILTPAVGSVPGFASAELNELSRSADQVQRNAENMLKPVVEESKRTMEELTRRMEEARKKAEEEAKKNR